MSDVNWWLMLLSFLLGALITWFWSVRRTTREVPRTVVDRDRDLGGSVGAKAAGVGAGVAGAAAGAAALGRHDSDVDLDPEVGTDADLTTRRGDLDVDRPTTELYDRTADEPVDASWEAPAVNAPDDPDLEAATVHRSSLDVPEVGTPDVDTPDMEAPEVESPGVAGGAAGAATAGAVGLGAASWASRSDDADTDDAETDVADADVSESSSDEPVRFTGGADRVEADPLEADPAEADSADRRSSSDAEIIESDADLETPTAPSGEADWADSSGTGATTTDALAAGPTGSVMSSRDSADLEAAQEPVVETEADDTPASAGAAAAGAGVGGAGAAGAAGTFGEKNRSGGGGGAKPVQIPEGKFGKGSADPAEDGSGPQGWTIKGNEDSNLFHTQDSPYHGRTKAEIWFDSEEAARGAGFVRWDERDRSGGSAGAAKLVEIPEGRFGKGSADPGDDGSGPEGWAIKGNENSMLFHTDDSPAYGRTKAEVWFQDEDAARKAGFTKWNERNR